MIDHTISMILEELLDRIFVRPKATNHDATKNIVHINSSNACNETSCNCIIQLNEREVNLDTVVHLDLTNCKLTSVPDRLSKLPLKSLNLSHNLLHSVPSCIFIGLDLLENLNLSYNSITEFETEPKCLLNLQVLDLRNNGMQYIPIWFVHAKSRKLQELYYSNNILGKTNECLYKEVFLYSINKMILKNSFILNENIAFIKSIQTLEVLNISNDEELKNKNSFTNYDDLFNEPAWQINIKSLNLTKLTMGFLPDGILSFVSLRELYLSRNAIFWLPDYIENLVNLEILDLSNNSMCFLPNTINNLRNLRILNLQYNKLSSIQMIDSLSLEILDVYENELDACDLDVCKYKYLDLEQNFLNTTLLNKLYIEKLENYRHDFNLKDRILGCCEENLEVISNISYEKLEDISDEHRDSSNITPNSSYEEECWDEERKEPNPDITPSDDEWQGYIPKPNPTNKPKENVNCLLEILYVDVD